MNETEWSDGPEITGQIGKITQEASDRQLNLFHPGTNIVRTRSTINSACKLLDRFGSQFAFGGSSQQHRPSASRPRRVPTGIPSKLTKKLSARKEG